MRPRTLPRRHFCGSVELARRDRDIRGWLTVVASRLCLDQVRSARARRESPMTVSALGRVRSDRRPDPADQVTLDDEVHDALTEVLRRLNPAERVAFVLHDVFQRSLRGDRAGRRPPGRHLPSAGPPRPGQDRAAAGPVTATVATDTHREVTTRSSTRAPLVTSRR